MKYDTVLLKTGADIEAVNLDGQTPLMVAVLHVSYKAARFLVENGADADKCDSGKLLKNTTFYTSNYDTF